MKKKFIDPNTVALRAFKKRILVYQKNYKKSQAFTCGFFLEYTVKRQPFVVLYFLYILKQSSLVLVKIQKRVI